MNTQPGPLVHECQCRVCQAGQDQETVSYHRQINLFLSRLSEPQRRWYVAVLAHEPPGFSDSELERITGLDRNTIRRGRHELEAGLPALPAGRQRQAGGGRIKAEKKTRS